MSVPKNTTLNTEFLKFIGKYSECRKIEDEGGKKHQIHVATIFIQNLSPVCREIQVKCVSKGV